MKQTTRPERLAILLLFVGTLLYAVTGPLRSVQGVSALPLLGVGIAVAGAALYILTSPTLHVSRTTLTVTLLVVLLVATHALLNGLYPHTTWNALDIVDKFYPVVLVFLLPILLTSTETGNELRSEWLLRGHVVATVCVTVVILAVGFQLVEAPSSIPLGERLKLPFERNTYPFNSHAIYFVYVVPAAVYSFARMLDGRNGYRRLYGVAFAALVGTALLTQIRKVYVALLAGLVLYGLFDSRYRGRVRRLLVLGSPLLVLGLYLVHRMAPESTFARIEQFEIALSFAARHPLGAGHGSVELLVGTHGPHNVFLDALTEYGMLAFLVLVAICGLTVVRAVRTGTRTSDVVTMVLAASAVGMLVGLQFESQYHLIRFWFLVALFHAHADLTSPSGESDSDEVRRAERPGQVSSDARNSLSEAYRSSR